MIPPESLKRSILEAARGQPVPARTARLSPTGAAAALPILATVVAYAVAVGAWDLVTGGAGRAVRGVASALGFLVGFGTATAGRPAHAGAAIVAGTVSLAAAGTWLVLPRRRSMLSPARGRLLAVVLALPVLVGVWHVLWGSTYVDPFVRTGWKCIFLTMATAPWPFLAVYRASRRIDPRHPGLTGAALGSAAGAWGAVMAAIWCPLSVGSHVLVGHVLPLVLWVGLGAAVGSRMFRLRRLPTGPVRYS